jgi:hypothetical protein
VKSSNQRDYGTQHRTLRRALLPLAIGTPCVRCGNPMLQGQKLDLDHTDDRKGYKGFAHAECNRRAGAYRQNHSHPENPPPRTSTKW